MATAFTAYLENEPVLMPSVERQGRCRCPAGNREPDVSGEHDFRAARGTRDCRRSGEDRRELSVSWRKAAGPERRPLNFEWLWVLEQAPRVFRSGAAIVKAAAAECVPGRYQWLEAVPPIRVYAAATAL